MLAFISALMSAHNVMVIVAAFAGVSALLTAIANYLNAIGDKVPGWIGTILSEIAVIVKFINGNFKA